MSLEGALHRQPDGVLPSTALAILSNWADLARSGEIAGRLDDPLSEWYSSRRARC
jgi:hypothetical protein